MLDFRTPFLAKAKDIAGEVAARNKGAANDIIDEVVGNSSDEKTLYLAALLKGYVAQFSGKDLPLKHLESFINGTYQVRGVGNSVHRDIFVDKAGKNVIPLCMGSALAFWKLAEMELTKRFGEDGKAFAASTALLLFSAADKRGRIAFVEELEKRNANPFAKLRVLEFAGGDIVALSKIAEPITQLFNYEDYTPAEDIRVSTADKDYISQDNPGPFFADKKWQDETQKYDYVLASNVFCETAVTGATDISQNLGRKTELDLLPHLSRVLKAGGGVIVSNTAHDGFEISPEAAKICGLSYAASRQPLHDSDQGQSGVYVLQSSPSPDMKELGVTKHNDGKNRPL